jgi:hypothetical protein
MAAGLGNGVLDVFFGKGFDGAGFLQRTLDRGMLG